ncbi:MAG: adenylyltransferase/cytidyltransferase family protein, partial [Halobacteriaceae archaeon]
MQVALGGTFDPIHDGHRKLFSKAFSLGDVTVGLTSDELASQTRFEER